MVREASKEDLDALLKLYLFLHEDTIPELNAHLTLECCLHAKTDRA